jgi:hypothetical protein
MVGGHFFVQSIATISSILKREVDVFYIYIYIYYLYTYQATIDQSGPCTLMLPELGSPAVGMEKYGYTEGAVFVLTPSVENWKELVRQPLPSQRMSESGRPVRKKTKPLPDPFAGLELRAEYMGYGGWKVRLTQGNEGTGVVG